MDLNSLEYKIIFTNDAVKDMDRIFRYISENLYSPNAARDLMNRVIEAIDKLKYIPKAHNVIKKHSKLKMEYRRVVIKNYVIIYTMDEIMKIIYVVNVFYARSDYLVKI